MVVNPYMRKAKAIEFDLNAIFDFKCSLMQKIELMNNNDNLYNAEIFNMMEEAYSFVCTCIMFNFQD